MLSHQYKVCGSESTFRAWLTAALKPHGIRAADVGRRVDGKAVTRRGIARADLAAAMTRRDRKRRGD